MGSAGAADAILLCSCQHLRCQCAGSQHGTSCYLVTDLSRKFLTVCTAITAWKENPKVNVLSRGEGALCICHAYCSLTGVTQISPKQILLPFLPFNAWISFFRPPTAIYSITVLKSILTRDLAFHHQLQLLGFGFQLRQ